MVGKCRRTSSTTCRSGFKWGGDACPREGYCVAPSRTKKKERKTPYKSACKVYQRRVNGRCTGRKIKFAKQCDPWQYRSDSGRTKGRCVNRAGMSKKKWWRSQRGKAGDAPYERYVTFDDL